MTKDNSEIPETSFAMYSNRNALRNWFRKHNRCYDIQATNLVSRLLVAGYPDGVSGK